MIVNRIPLLTLTTLNAMLVSACGGDGSPSTPSTSFSSQPSSTSPLGATTVNAVGGIATFAALTVTQPGSGFSLMASASGYDSAQSVLFNVSPSLAGFNATGAVEGCEILYVSGVDGVKTMKRIQYLQFTDQTVSVN